MSLEIWESGFAGHGRAFTGLDRRERRKISLELSMSSLPFNQTRSLSFPQDPSIGGFAHRCVYCSLKSLRRILGDYHFFTKSD
jgi:hypothetical protein